MCFRAKYEIFATNGAENRENALDKSQKCCQQSYYEVTSYHEVIISSEERCAHFKHGQISLTVEKKFVQDHKYDIFKV